MLSRVPRLAGSAVGDEERWVVPLLLLFLLLRQFYYVGWEPGSVPNVDLPSFYMASYALREGVSPYSAELRGLVSTTLGQHVFPYLSPPPSLYLLAPLSHWPFRAVGWFVLACNYLAAAVSVFLMFSVAGLGRRAVGARCLLAAVFVTSFGLHHTLVHGQINLVVLVLLCLACIAMMRGVRGGAAGVLIALAALLKQSPLLMFALLLVRRRWTDLIAGAGVLAAALLAGVFTLPTQAWVDWNERVAPSLRFGHTPLGLFHPAAPHNQSVNGFVSRLFADSEWSRPLWVDPDIVEPVAWALVGCVLLATGWALLRDGNRPGSFVAIDFGLVLTAMFMVSPLSWDHHLVLVFPAVCVAAVETLRRGRAGWEKVVVVVAALLLTLPLRLDAVSLKSGLPTLLVSARLFGVALVWLVLWRLGSVREVAAATAEPAVAT